MPEVFIHSTVIPIAFAGKRLAEPYGEHLYVVQNPPAKPLTQMEMDDVYALPYKRTWHPSYDDSGRRSGDLGSQIQPGQQPRLFWRLQFLCTDVPSGTDHPDEKP